MFQAGSKETGGGRDSEGKFVNGLFWAHKELSAEQLQAMIGQCRFMVASRFHAMVFALSMQVPVMVVGWSHKYGEVMEQFGLEGYAVDYAGLKMSRLQELFRKMEGEEQEIRQKIAIHLPAVRDMANENMAAILQLMQ